MLSLLSALATTPMFSLLPPNGSISHCSIIISFCFLYFSSSSQSFWYSYSSYFLRWIQPFMLLWILMIFFNYGFISFSTAAALGPTAFVLSSRFRFWGEMIISAKSWSNYFRTSYFRYLRSFNFFSKYFLLFSLIWFSLYFLSSE